MRETTADNARCDTVRLITVIIYYTFYANLQHIIDYHSLFFMCLTENYRRCFVFTLVHVNPCVHVPARYSVSDIPNSCSNELQRRQNIVNKR